jgi:hypothetical protein
MFIHVSRFTWPQAKTRVPTPPRRGPPQANHGARDHEMSPTGPNGYRDTPFFQEHGNQLERFQGAVPPLPKCVI